MMPPGGATPCCSHASQISRLSSTPSCRPRPPPPRSKIAPEEAQRALKDLVFSRWLAEGCEERSDTLKMVGELVNEASS